MASNAEKKKSKPNIVETSIEIVNTGIVQAKEVRLGRDCAVWHFLKQRENWLAHQHKHK